MDGSQQSGGGFSPHLQKQLQEAAMTVTTSPNRARGQRWRGRGNFHPGHQLHHQEPTRQYVSGPQHAQPSNIQSWGNQTMPAPTDPNSFPPLGAAPSRLPANTYQNTPTNTQQHPPHTKHHITSQQTYSAPTTQSPHDPRRDTFVRGRGGHFRGRGYGHSTVDQRQQMQGQGQGQTRNVNEFHRPPPIQRRLFTGTNPQFHSLEDQRAFQKRIMNQSDYLNHLASQSLKNQLSIEEQQAKESFRKELEAIAQKVIADALTKSSSLDPSHVQLKLYGSLGSGFGVAGSDMDLLLAFPQNEGPLGNIEIESRRMLEKALLDAGIGARLLTNTRVPILRVCERPNSELLKNLRECRSKWEQGLDSHDPLPVVDEGFGPLPTDLLADAAAEALAGLDLSAHEIPLPDSPIPDHAKLEFVGDCGIQCDVNFSNYVALHNTRLLRTYGSCDSRVRQVGVFVKSWAKARDINTPYRGTLSSYGYILMVLHYLMHIVNPPLIPNLQEIAKQKDSWDANTKVDLVEGCDVRFVRDSDEIQAILQDMPRNHESVGSLLRGFFWYYADPRGFHWNQDVVSFQSRSGRLSKRSKGWTEAKWSESNSNVRLRYLLAIEDPFEIDHNVGRTVGHSGIVAIRDEFRRAWAAIDNIKFDDEARIWYWLNPAGQTMLGDQLMSVMENRGDLLRKDQDYHKQKTRQMRQELEAKEKALQEAAAQETETAEGREMNGTSKKSQSVTQDVKPPLNSSSSTLINNNNFQVKKLQHHSSNRRVLHVEDDDDDDDEETWTTQDVKPANIDWSQPFQKTEISIDAGWTNDAGNNVLDWGQPFKETEISINTEWVDDVNKNVPDWSQPFKETEISINARWADDAIDKVKLEEEVTDRSQQVPMFQQSEDSVDISDNRFYDHSGAKVIQAELSNLYDDEALDVMIQWDNHSHGGRWLRWRDRQIRNGRWTGPVTERFRTINQEFPYDPDMTMKELAIKNKILCSLYWNSYTPQRQVEGDRTDQQMISNSKAHSRTLVPAKDLRPASMAVKSKGLTPSIELNSDTSTRPSTSTTSKPKKSRPKKTRNPQRRLSKISDTMKNSSISSTQQSVQSTAPPDAHDDKLTNLTTEPTDPVAKELLKIFKTSSLQRNNTDLRPPQPTNLTPPPNHEVLSATSPQPQSSTQSSNSQPLVPLTLYPDHSPSTRPRDEDPNIMPIPRALNFQFDPRQLADLEVIRRGGTGCARFGEEFDVEFDYEFGGGGEIVRVDGGSEGDARVLEEKEQEKEERWSGKGDVEGLLGELPGVVD